MNSRLFYSALLLTAYVIIADAKVLQDKNEKVIAATAPIKKEAVQEIENMKQLREVLSKREPVILMFYAPWCSACKSMKTTLNTISDRFSKRVHIAKINADCEECKEAVDFFGIEAIPTLIFKNLGVMTEEQLEATLTSFLGKETVKKKEAPRPPIKPDRKKTGAPKKQTSPKKAGGSKKQTKRK